MEPLLHFLRRLPELLSRGNHFRTACPPGAATLQLWPLVQLFLTGRIGLISAPIGCARDGFHYRCCRCYWVTAKLHFPFLAAFHSFPLLGLPAAGCSAKISVLWPCDVQDLNVRPVSFWHSREATLHCWNTHRVPTLSGEALCWGLALGGFMQVLHLGMYLLSYIDTSV